MSNYIVLEKFIYSDNLYVTYSDFSLEMIKEKLKCLSGLEYYLIVEDWVIENHILPKHNEIFYYENDNAGKLIFKDCIFVDL